MARDQVFISYSHADSEWLNRLEIMLAPLQRQGALDIWADTRIQPGQLWKEEIQQALARAKVAILLVSPDFLASDFIDQHELPPLLEAARKEGLTILWVPIRPSLYRATDIARFQAAYDPKTPLSTLPLAQQEAELVRIAEKLMAIRPLLGSPAPPPPTPEPILISPSVTSPPRVWGPRLIVMVLSGVVGGAGLYYLGKGRFEKMAESTEPKKPPATLQNIDGGSAPKVQALQQQTAHAVKLPVEFQDTLKDGGQGPLMVVIPAGRFQMGSPDTELDRQEISERPHEVEVNAFAISKYEVTFEEYDRFADATKREKPSDAGWGRGRRPVINVTWDDAVAYADWISKQTGQPYRLPTEAEWEYAARAGTMTPFSFGETISTDQANYDGNYVYGNGRKGSDRQKTVEVGQFPANAWGVHDMHGNVWEWTCSVYAGDYGGEEEYCANPGTSGARAARGGAWDVAPLDLRGAVRYGDDPHTKGENEGFRLARTVPSPL